MGILDAPSRPPFLRGSSIAYLGDSHVQGPFATYNYGDAFPLHVGLASQQKYTSAGFHGIGGERSDQILARVQTALARRPTYLLVQAGTNDIGQGISGGQSDIQIVNTIATNLKAIYRSAKAVGSIPVACTVPPQNTAGQRQRVILKANIWIRRFAIQNGLPLVDFYTLLAKDGITATPAGNWKDAYAADGTHGNAAAAAAIGALVVSTLNAAGPAGTMPSLCTDLVDSGQGIWLMRNPLFQATSGDLKKPDNFSTYGASTSDANTVYSLVSDALVPGKMQQIAMNASATTSGGLQGVSTVTVAAGDIIAIGGYITTDGVTTSQVQIQCGGGTTYKPVSLGIGAAVTRGVYYMEFAAPSSGAVTVNLLAGLRAGFAATVAFSYPSVVNLTAAIGETVAQSPN
ncbi:GDSL-type esterase/lipase family protein [Arthrobacter sp. NPDC080073]|uniref:SGNH/GDSL hydrolase family protein n=1 Tax=Arthrobacter sp. NPDC080073 TaxID=3155919 RepID=UPI0034124A85